MDVRPFLISIALPVLFFTGLSAAAPGASFVPVGHVPDTVDRELSRRFIPPRYRMPDPGARERVRAWVQRETGDSTQVSFKGGLLRLNGDALRRLQSDSGDVSLSSSTQRSPAPGSSTQRSFSQRARRKLEQVAGTPVEEDPTYSATDYSPDDMALQTTPQWPLKNDGSLTGSTPGLDLGMTTVWEKFDGDDSLVIAVLDAGINFLHPDLQGRWFVNKRESQGLPGVDDDGNGFVDDSTGWDFVDDDNRPFDTHGHGTYLSGVIAAKSDNGMGVAGMLPRVRILPIRVLGTTGDGSSAAIAAGMRYAAKMGVKVLNFSIGINSTALDTTLRNAFIVARDSGMIVAAASANDARNLDDPAQARAPSNYGYANVYMVASHHQAGGLSGFSNYGAKSVDLAAPGENIVTTSIPVPAELGRHNFEDTVKRWTFSPTANWAVVADTLEGAKSLQWVSGTTTAAKTATATLDSIDLRGRSGTAVSFMLEFKPAGTGAQADWVYIEVQPVPSNGGTSATWTTVGLVTTAVAGRKTVAFSAGVMDNKLMRMRFRNSFIVTGTRSLHIDDIRIKVADEDPTHQANYIVTGGTSLAAPYFAAYAGLMRIASQRAGVALTRERMLAGVTPDSQLTGKVATGARLNVAKGLDFYLRTVPALTSVETDTTWTGSAHYTLSVRDSAGQALSGYTFATGPGTAGGSLSGNVYAWSPGTQTGSFTARFRAEKSPLVLRKQVRFTVSVATAVAAARGGPATLRIGGRSFYLPPSALQGAMGGARGTQVRTLRLDFYGADGRTVQTLTGELQIPAGAQGAVYRVDRFPGVGLRAWLDGTPLRSAPETAR